MIRLAAACLCIDGDATGDDDDRAGDGDAAPGGPNNTPETAPPGDDAPLADPGDPFAGDAAIMMRRAAAALPKTADAGGSREISGALPCGGGRGRAPPGVPGLADAAGLLGPDSRPRGDAPVGVRGVSGTNPGEDDPPTVGDCGGFRGVNESSATRAAFAAAAASASHGSETPRIRIGAGNIVTSSGTPSARRNCARSAASPLRAAPNRARNDAAPSDNAGFPARRRTASAVSDKKSLPTTASSVARGVANVAAGDAGSNSASRSNPNPDPRASGLRAPRGLLARATCPCPCPPPVIAFGVSPAGVPKLLSPSRLDGGLDGVSTRSARVLSGGDDDRGDDRGDDGGGDGGGEPVAVTFSFSVSVSRREGSLETSSS
jgi:hypothetical protein